MSKVQQHHHHHLAFECIAPASRIKSPIPQIIGWLKDRNLKFKLVSELLPNNYNKSYLTLMNLKLIFIISLHCILGAQNLAAVQQKHLLSSAQPVHPLGCPLHAWILIGNRLKASMEFEGIRWKINNWDQQIGLKVVKQVVCWEAPPNVIRGAIFNARKLG